MVAYRKWYGQPQVNTRMPPPLYNAVMRTARAQGVPPSTIVRQVLNKWEQDGNAEPVPTASAVAARLPIPQTAASRPDTGRTETIERLQEIDLERKVSRETAKRFSD